MKFMLFCTAFVAAVSAHSKEVQNNAVGVELLGRGFLYSVFYERSLADESLQFGVGFSFYKRPIFPVYINIITTQNESVQTYLTAGVLITDPDRTFEGGGNKNNEGIYKFGIPMGGIGLNAHITESLSIRGSVYAYAFLGRISFILPWIGGSVVFSF